MTTSSDESKKNKHKAVRVYEPPARPLPARPPFVWQYMPPTDAMPLFHYSRPLNSNAWVAFMKRFIVPVVDRIDEMGNAWVQQGTVPILWSCHTDTVAHWSGRQDVALDRDGMLRLAKGHKIGGRVLGGDDTVGVYLMLKMLKAGIPGLYLFHNGEEHGCIGSRHIAEKTPEVVKDMKIAIALDRRGYDSIITEMGGQKVCSKIFAETMADELNKTLGRFKPDPTGLTTDTKCYRKLIPECTNLGVGYHDSHSSSESVDLRFVGGMVDALTHLNLDALLAAVKRDPLASDYDYTQWRHYRYGDQGVGYGADEFESWCDWYDRRFGKGAYEKDKAALTEAKDAPATKLPAVVDVVATAVGPYEGKSPWSQHNDSTPIVRGGSSGQVRGFLSEQSPDDDLLPDGKSDLEQLCEEFPEIAAVILEEFGCDYHQFVDYLRSVYGTDTADEAVQKTIGSIEEEREEEDEPTV